MLLTVPQRRRLIADLRRDGYTPMTVVAVLLLDAIVLGMIASVLGLALGDELSIRLFHAAPGYLSSAFAVGGQRVLSASSIAIAAGGGMVAAVVAVLSPLRDILSRDPLAAIAPREGVATGRGGARTALAGLVCLAGAGAILFAAPQAAIAGMVLLIGALLLVLPFVLGAMLALIRRLAPLITSAVPHVAAMELGVARSRGVAIAATGAIAVFGGVAIQGAHGDLLTGLEDAAHDMNAFTDVWVSPAGSYNLLNATSFVPGQQGKLARLPGVRAVRVYRGGLLDWKERRVWVIAPPSQASPLVPPSQIVVGNEQDASKRVRAGGWVVLSQALASERHLRIGQVFTLPSPEPMRFRVAALSTNIGWAPGAIVMNASDYARAWGSDDASAYNVLLAGGATPAQVTQEIRRALGAGSGLSVQSAEQHAARQRALSRQGLARLTQIATLVLVGAVLAIAAAMGTLLWQRRARLAKLKLEGFHRAELWRTVVLESVLLVGAGCTTGALFGLLGQQLLDRALSSIINFPIAHSLALPTALETFAVVVGAAAAILAVPGWFAVRVPAGMALQD
jgi:putative ABC transport system permease protein